MLRQTASHCNRKNALASPMALSLDGARTRLCDARCRPVLPDRRAWSDPKLEGGLAPGGTQPSATDADAWPQRDGGQPFRAPVDAVGPRSARAGQLRSAAALGAGPADIKA